MSEFEKICIAFVLGFFLAFIIMWWIDDFISWHESKWKRR